MRPLVIHTHVGLINPLGDLISSAAYSRVLGATPDFILLLTRNYALGFECMHPMSR